MKNIYKIQVYSSIMCGYFSIIFMLKGKSLLDYTNLYCVIYGKQRKLKNPKIRYIFEKHQFLLLFADYSKKKNQLRY